MRENVSKGQVAAFAGSALETRQSAVGPFPDIITFGDVLAAFGPFADWHLSSSIPIKRTIAWI